MVFIFGVCEYFNVLVVLVVEVDIHVFCIRITIDPFVGFYVVIVGWIVWVNLLDYIDVVWEISPMFLNAFLVITNSSF